MPKWWQHQIKTILAKGPGIIVKILSTALNINLTGRMILKLQKSTQKCSHIYCHNLCLTVARCVSQLSVIGTCPAAARSQVKLKLWVAKRQVDTYRQVGTYKGRAEMQAQQSKHLDLGIEVKWQVISTKFLPPNSNKALLCKYSYFKRNLGFNA